VQNHGHKKERGGGTLNSSHCNVADIGHFLAVSNQNVRFFWPRCNTTQLTRIPNAIKGKEVKWSRYRPGVAQRVGRGIALLFHDRGTRRGWVVSSTPRLHFTPGKDPVPILQEAGWAPGPVCTGGKSRPHRDSILDRPARSQWLYRMSYPAHT